MGGAGAWTEGATSPSPAGPCVLRGRCRECGSRSGEEPSGRGDRTSPRGAVSFEQGSRDWACWVPVCRAEERSVRRGDICEPGELSLEGGFLNRALPSHRRPRRKARRAGGRSRPRLWRRSLPFSPPHPAPRAPPRGPHVCVHSASGSSGSLPLFGSQNGPAQPSTQTPFSCYS